MRIVSFGDLYIDYYLKNGIVQGICGGKTNANILANLSSTYPCAFLGVVGNDTKGVVAVKSLEELNVDVSKIKKVDGETKTYFLDRNFFSKECPYCDRLVGYEGTKINENDVISEINKDDIIVIDNLKPEIISIVNKVPNKAFIDVGYLGEFLYSSLDEIKEVMSGRFEIINMNERVYHLLKKKFQIDSLDLYEILKPKILIITRGKKGSDFIYDGEIYKKEIDYPVKEVDVNGAGDAFFSVFIMEYLKEEAIDERWISKTYMKAQALVCKVLKNVGARTHLEPLYKIENYEECICKNFTLK